MTLKTSLSKHEAAGKGGYAPPSRCRGLLSDVRAFLLHRPAVRTLIRFRTKGEREEYRERIMKRLGIRVEQYGVLNIHKIGIEAPVERVFKDLLDWDGDSTCWPNHIAQVERQGGALEHIKIFLLGRRTYPFGLKKGLFGFKFVPLFNLDELKFRREADPHDAVNGHYLLYKCSGGYPIGFFAMYVRAAVAGQEEKEETQLYMLVGFNFYGRKDWSGPHFFNRLWERVHNRVTANVMNRFKQLCEWRAHRHDDEPSS